MNHGKSGFYSVTLFWDEFSPALTKGIHVIKPNGHLTVLIFLALSTLNTVDSTILRENYSSHGFCERTPTLSVFLLPFRLFWISFPSLPLPSLKCWSSSDSVLGPPLPSLSPLASSPSARPPGTIYVSVLLAGAPVCDSFLSSGHVHSTAYSTAPQVHLPQTELIILPHVMFSASGNDAAVPSNSSQEPGGPPGFSPL